MELFKELMLVLLAYEPLVSFVAGLLNEDLLFFLAFLAGEGSLNLGIVFVLGFFGIMAHDIILYLIVRLPACQSFVKRWNPGKRHQGIVRFIQTIGRNGYLIPLMISKFIYGTRVALAWYAAHHEPRFWRYFARNALAVIVWLAVMLPIGWLAGRGFSELAHVVRGIEKVIGVLVLFVILMYLINYVLKRFFLRRAKKFVDKLN